MILAENGRDVCENDPILQNKTKDLQKKNPQTNGYMNYKATDGWLARLKSIHNIKKRTNRELDSAEATSNGNLQKLSRYTG